jgi:DNA polymerase-3 subunit epsilon
MVATGRRLHLYINPERPVDPEAEKVHGLSDEFLSGKPVFEAISGEFLDFIGEDPLVIHNAPFDAGFLNAELARLSLPALDHSRLVDTLIIARRKYPGAPASLDALCRRFGIDNSHRDLHGALVDADLLAEVYIELKGGRQPNLLGAETNSEKTASPLASDTAIANPAQTPSDGPDALARLLARDRPLRPLRPHPEKPEEKLAWEAFLAKVTDPIWLDE